MSDEESFDDFVQKFAPAPDEIDVKFSSKTKELAQELAAKVHHASQIKAELKNLNKRINEISFTLLPDLFNAQGITVIGISNGVNLELTPYFKAGLTKKMDAEKKEQGLEYLRENAPELLKTEVVLSFAAHDYESAALAVEFLKGAGLEPIVEETVHHSTLTSWVKEQFLDGQELPLDILNAKVGAYVKFVPIEEEKTDALKKVKNVQAREFDDEIPI